MVKSLRKRHVQIWMALSLLIPVCLTASWLGIRRIGDADLWQPAPVIRLPVLLKTAGRPGYLLELRTDSLQTVIQLQLQRTEPLASPQVTLYQIPGAESNIDQGKYLGVIGPRGTYRFQLEKSNHSDYYILVYDKIHQRALERIKL